MISFDNQLDFIDSHYKKLESIASSISVILPTMRKGSRSKTLEVLADKISFMILKGDSPNIKPMLKAMLSRGVKKQSRPGGGEHLGYRNGRSLGFGKEFLGYGHFRWDWKAHTLTELELERLKEYFQL